MPIVSAQNTQAVADTASNTVIEKKPVGDHVFIRRISLYSMKNIEFARWLAWLDTPDGIETISLGKKILPSVHAYGATFWTGRVEWRENFRLWFRYKTQEAVNKVYFYVEYEVVPRKLEKKRWGER